MSHYNLPQIKYAPSKIRSSANGRSAARGFTLVETMVATVLLSMIILSILGVLIGSYRVAANARYRDHARYVIKSLADQFLTQQTIDSFGVTLPLFNPTGGPTGVGMVWTNSDGSPGLQTGGGLEVALGDNTGAPIQAYVTRSIYPLFPGVTPGTAPSGTTAVTIQTGAPGYMLRGDFTISYTMPPSPSPQAQNYSQTVTVVRSVP